MTLKEKGGKKMKDLAKKATVVLLTSLLALSLSAGLSFSADKLVVEDGTLNKVFSVTDQGVVSGAKMGLGTYAPLSQMHVIDEAAAPDRGIITGQHNSGAQAATIKFFKSRGTFGFPETMVNGDYFGVFQSWGHDGAAYQRTAQFGFRSSGPVSAGTIPTDIIFWAGESAATLTETLRLKSTGIVNMNGLAGSYSGGSAYVCVNNAGDIFASESPCP